MNPWRSLLRDLQAELDRNSQEVAGRSVLPNAVDVTLPATQFEPWTPILGAVTAELGTALAEWAVAGRRGWYDETGPLVTVHLEDGARPQIVCEFRKAAPQQLTPSRESRS